jgi:hypothetical protein
MESYLEVSLLVTGEMQRAFPGNVSLSLFANKAKQSLLIDCRVAWLLAVTIDRYV